MNILPYWHTQSRNSRKSFRCPYDHPYTIRFVFCHLRLRLIVRERGSGDTVGLVANKFPPSKDLEIFVRTLVNLHRKLYVDNDEMLMISQKPQMSLAIGFFGWKNFWKVVWTLKPRLKKSYATNNHSPIETSASAAPFKNSLRSGQAVLRTRLRHY
jgi:hypothetical protein